MRRPCPRHHVPKLREETRAAGGAGVAPVHERMDTHVHAVGSGDIHERAEVVDMAVHAAVGQQSGEVQPPARPLHVRQQLKQRGVGGKFARLHRHVDAGHILIHDASGPDIEVPHFRIAHISGGQPHRAPGGVDARRARQGDEPIDVGRPRKAGGIARTGGSQSVAIKNEEQRRGKGHDALPWSWGLSLRPRRVLRDGGTPQAFRHTMREIPSKGIRCGKARARPAGKYARRCR